MGWQQDGKLDYDAGDVGGDMQAGRAASVRFRLDEARKATAGMSTDPRSGPSLRSGEPLHSLMTIYIYPIKHEENDGCSGSCTPGSLDLQQQIEYMVCTDPTDPGSAERWADYEHEILSDLDGTDLELPTVEVAEAHARRLLASWVPALVTWDGKAPWE